MSTKLNLLALLNENKGRFTSGQELADSLGVSRNSVWKAVKALQDQGYNIKSLPSTGYKLLDESDVLSPDYIKENLKSPCKVHIFDRIDSTNNYAKTLDCSQMPQLIISDEQTKGRGRLGRDFFSPSSSGLYMSIAFKPDFGLDQAMLITTTVAVAVCRAMERVSGLKPKIKWVNDIYLNGKKICGILTEAESNFEIGQIEKIIVGVGINCFEGKMPEELQDIASYMKNPSRKFSRNELAVEITNEFFGILQDFDRFRIVREYKSKSMILGEQILIFNPAIAKKIGRPDSRLNEGIRARAIDIDDNGGLVVEYLEGRLSREMETLTTGEVTIRKI